MTSKIDSKAIFSSSPPHPARYSPQLLPIFADLLRRRAHYAKTVFDPFGGTGERLDELAVLFPDKQFRAIEIEPAWHVSERVCLGNALRLPLFDDSVDVILTSPTYGNRMADHHNARDNSPRRTYRHMLGEPLHPDNSGAMQWGPRYRDFHTAAWKEVRRVLRRRMPDVCGLLLLNIKNHIRSGEEQLVTEWHIDCLHSLGFEYLEDIEVAVPGMRFGQNREKRIEHEYVIAFARN